MKGRLLNAASQKLLSYSIKELTLLLVKLVLLGFSLLVITYVLTHRISAYYQQIISDHALPMTALQRDLSNSLVDYALIQDEIIQSKTPSNHKPSINTQALKTEKILNNFHQFVMDDNALIKPKEMLDIGHTALVASIIKMDDLHTSRQQLKTNLQEYKYDIQSLLESMIISREKLSGILALASIQKKISSEFLTKKLLQADLKLGINISKLSTNVSLLMHVENSDQLNNLNLNQLTQNIKETRKSLSEISLLSTPEASLKRVMFAAKDISSVLKKIELKFAKHSYLPFLIQEKFAIDADLEQESLRFKETLSEIENYLKTISGISNQKVSTAITNNETVSLISTVLFIVLSFVFISFLVVVITAIARQINSPIERLNQTMRRLTHGDLSARLEVNESVSDEFANLWVDFNHFAEENQKTIIQQEVIFDNADIGIAWLKDRKCLQVNKKILDIFGYQDHEIYQKDIGFLYCHYRDYQEVGDIGYKTLNAAETFIGEYEMRRKDGSHFWCRITGKSIGSNNEKNSIWLFDDVSETKSAEEKLYRLANFDSLTQLANRSLFSFHLDEAITRSHLESKQFALLFIDIDRFKHINDSLGHEAGDLVLSEVSNRMKSVLHHSDILARLGGDEFTILLDNISSTSEAEGVARKILHELGKPIIYKQKEVYTGCSIGISRFPVNGIVKSDLLSCADAAMYHAKKSGRNRYSFYSEAIGESNTKYMQLSQDLKKAVKHNEFELHYQPKIDMRTRQIIGAEALIRWNKPGEGLISPFKFIHVLEEIGLMAQVGEWIITEACNTIKIWLDNGFDPGKIAINLSERQFGDNLLLNSVTNVLQSSGIPANNIEFEITESLMMRDSEITMQTLRGIKNLGIAIAMDDFGTGYSSLAYLKKFPIDILKIDRAFVKDITDDPDDEAIVEAIIAMAKQLKLTTVAEGIETEEQYQFLYERGCEIGQGYLFSKPITAEKMFELHHKKQPIISCH